jgi:large repetitive protein
VGDSRERAVPIGGDTTAPATVASVGPEPNPSGWHNSAVTVTLSASDEPGGSGVREVVYTLAGVSSGAGSAPGNTATIAVTSEGETVVTYFARDNAGNQEAIRTITVRIDRTAPQIACTPSPAANLKGWHNSDVTVSFAASDALSGGVTAPESVTLRSESAGQIVVRTVTDTAGNSASATCSVRIDKTAPVIRGLPADGCSLAPPRHQLVLVAAVEAEDGISGLDGPVLVVGRSSEPEDSQGDGSSTPDIVIEGGRVQLRAERRGGGEGRVYTLDAAATDNAGNRAVGGATCVVPHDR